MNRPIYICFEGLDGSGKSSTHNKVFACLQQEGIRVQGVCPTRSTCHCIEQSKCCCNSIERLFNRNPWLHRSRFLRMFLYAHRSNYAADHINLDVDLLLGDRSLVTSYICRWTRFNCCNRFLVWIVNRLEARIPAPDYVIYFDVPQEELKKRLTGRGNQDIDETDKRSQAMKKAYDELRNHPSIIRRIAQTRWYVINGCQAQEDVNRDVIECIRQLLAEHKSKT